MTNPPLGISLLVGSQALSYIRQWRSAFGIALKLTTLINLPGAFPKSDRWSSRIQIRERTLQARRTATQCLRHRTMQCLRHRTISVPVQDHQRPWASWVFGIAQPLIECVGQLRCIRCRLLWQREAACCLRGTLRPRVPNHDNGSWQRRRWRRVASANGADTHPNLA